MTLTIITILTVELYPSKSYHLIQKLEAIKFKSEKFERLKSKNLFFYPKTNKLTRKNNCNYQKHNNNCQKSKGLSYFVVKICFLDFIWMQTTKIYSARTAEVLRWIQTWPKYGYNRLAQELPTLQLLYIHVCMYLHAHVRNRQSRFKLYKFQTETSIKILTSLITHT